VYDRYVIDLNSQTEICNTTFVAAGVLRRPTVAELRRQEGRY
jgi:hypothetical protein